MLMIKNTVAVMIPIIANTTRVKYNPKLTCEFSYTRNVLSLGGPLPSRHLIGSLNEKLNTSVRPLYSAIGFSSKSTEKKIKK